MRARILAMGVAVALLLAACGNSSSSGKSESTIPQNAGATPTTAADLSKKVPVTAPGVTDTEIITNAVVTETNSPTGSYAPLVDGVRAYFAMVNDGGGIYGRQLKLNKVHDDQLGNNAQATRAALNDKAFATFGATNLFTGAPLLAKANQPTFIWNINPEFAGHNNIFANESALCFKCATQVVPWVAKQLGATKIAIIAYNVAQQSKDCATGLQNSFAKYGEGAQVVFKDDSLPYAAPLAADVTAMKNKGVQFIGTCIDFNESFVLGKEMLRQGMKATQSLPNGYDADFVSKNAAALDGALVGAQFDAFEHQPPIAEQQKIKEWTSKTGVQLKELTTVGWILADELVTGLKLAGPNFTQQKVIDALNTLTAYTANGMVAPINWTKGHVDPQKDPSVLAPDDLLCGNFVKVVGGKFQAVFDQPGKPFVCFKRGDPNIDNPQFLNFAPG